MADNAPRTDPAGYETLAISRRELKALSGLEGMAGGPLSPLARMQAPAGASDPGALIAAWEALDVTWRWSVPALIDPHRTIALVMGDGNTSLIGQYLFPDAEAYGPGFHVDVGGEGVALTGPLSLGVLRAGLYSHLALEDVAEAEPFRTELSAYHFWALMACLDAYRAVALERRLLRASGAPLGVGIADAAKAWTDGVSSVNPGWAVSLFSLLVPDRVPGDLEERLPELLSEMSRHGHLEELRRVGSGDALYALSEALGPLLWGLTTALNFGLVTQRLSQSQTAEVTVLGGWRSPGGLWMADLSDMESGGVSLALTGPALADDIIYGILGDDALAPPWEEFAMETPYDRDVLVSRLREMEAAGEAAAAAAAGVPEEAAPAYSGSCSRCSRELRDGERFCRVCGAEVETPMPVAADAIRPVCPACGKEMLEGERFCAACGSQRTPSSAGTASCQACGKAFEGGERFCAACGSPVGGA